MTEYLLNLDHGKNNTKWGNFSEAAKWSETIKMLLSVHDAVTNNWNAYIWWYLQRFYSFIGDGEEGTANGEVLKRGFAFSHFSKFVRPNYVRVGVQSPANSYLKVTAYKKGNQTVLVIINPEGFSVQRVQFEALNPRVATSYTTTETSTLTKKNLSITSNKPVELDIPPSSITTIVVEQ